MDYIFIPTKIRENSPSFKINVPLLMNFVATIPRPLPTIDTTWYNSVIVSLWVSFLQKVTTKSDMEVFKSTKLGTIKFSSSWWTDELKPAAPTRCLEYFDFQLGASCQDKKSKHLSNPIQNKSQLNRKMAIKPRSLWFFNNLH